MLRVSVPRSDLHAARRLHISCISRAATAEGGCHRMQILAQSPTLAECINNPQNTDTDETTIFYVSTGCRMYVRIVCGVHSIYIGMRNMRTSLSYACGVSGNGNVWLRQMF